MGRWWVVAVVCLTVGCAEVVPPIQSVTGTVMYRGKPLPRVRVEFIPETATGPRVLRATAVTDDDGRFTLICDDGRTGAVRGRYIVLITPVTPRSPERDRNPQEPESKAPPARNPPPGTFVPQQYTAIHSSPLRCEVKPGGERVALELQP